MTRLLRRSDLHPQQRTIAQLCRDHRALLIVARMGSGKTAATLTVLRDALDAFDVQRVLIVAPLRVAKDVWPEEIETWQHTRALSVAVALGAPAARARAVDAGAEITIINFENLTWLHEYVGGAKGWPFDCVVIDESSAFKAGKKRTTTSKRKNAKGRTVVTKGGKLTRFGALARVRNKIRRMILLTGTPAPNGVHDLWGQVYLLDQGARLGSTMTAFEQRWFEKNTYTYEVKPKPHAEQEIMARISDVMFELPPPADLPEPVFVPITVPLERATLREYAQFKRTLVSEIYDVEAVSRGVLTNKLLQFANGSMYQENGEVVKVHDAKIQALDDLITRAAGDPLLVLYSFKFDLAEIKKLYPRTVCLNDGDDVVKRWNDGKIKLLAAHPKCLHPSTEVLTETRGWIPIIYVEQNERVFDGVEFVEHSGLKYSGYMPVIDVFGIRMTLNHRLLVGGEWREARDVATDSTAREAARYCYADNAFSVGGVRELRSSGGNPGAEFSKEQQAEIDSLSFLSGSDGFSDLPCVDRNASSSSGRGESELRGEGCVRISGLGDLCEFRARHGEFISKRSDTGADRCEWRLLQRELSLGNEHGATGQQAHEPRSVVPGGDDALGGLVPSYGREQDTTYLETSEGNDAGGRGGRCSGEHLRYGKEFDRGAIAEDGTPVGGSEAARAHVYDLVNCGPRNRFLIRNADGEVFVSHNSCAHGLNLQFGGHLGVWYGLTWSLELYQQANARLARPGQKWPVAMYQILADGTDDKRVLDVLDSRDATQESITRAVRRFIETA